ncbi:MAG TPA: EF-hand domain-containing protein [Planctomycetota bacterium]|jgi:hypothetical protein
MTKMGVVAAAMAALLIGASPAYAKGGKKNRQKKTPAQRWTQRFSKIDANGDGKVTLEEYLAFRQAHKGKHHKK